MLAIKNATLIMRDHLIPDAVILLENGVIIRDIDNADHQAETELESYFNVDFNEE